MLNVEITVQRKDENGEVLTSRQITYEANDVNLIFDNYNTVKLVGDGVSNLDIKPNYVNRTISVNVPNNVSEKDLYELIYKETNIAWYGSGIVPNVLTEELLNDPVSDECPDCS